MADFKIWFRDTIESEGGWDNRDTTDDGIWRSRERVNGQFIGKQGLGDCIGTTYGITAYEYSNFLGHAVTLDEMKNMPKEHAMQIAKEKYWDKMRCDQVNDQAIAGQIADNGYNIGLGMDLKNLQAQLNIPITGRMDDFTLNAINNI